MILGTPFESGENVLYRRAFIASPGGSPFEIIVTDRALIVPERKILDQTHPWHMARKPYSTIREVAVRKLPSLTVWFLSIAFGLGGSLGIVLSLLNKDAFPSHMLLISFMALSGLYLPFSARKRVSLVVQFVKGRYVWTPPLFQFIFGLPFPLDNFQRSRSLKYQREVLSACRSAGLTVNDEGPDSYDTESG